MTSTWASRGLVSGDATEGAIAIPGRYSTQTIIDNSPHMDIINNLDRELDTTLTEILSSK